MPPLDVPADPMVGAPTGRVFIVEPLEDPVPEPDPDPERVGTHAR
jgi:hypothetical protein